ncbi:hypothetical protein C8D87_1207 [Lentzea atacamensis]|uniref:Peptidase C14 caspase domain-containing protein n=1 Tax=Lentzea atacamensis TaxID=531938 RepID=A0ABX9DUF9_9PSEU|nr:caspase family protein [Lentzea atacamensis]RAS57884.1 hypothetical protein C8D87_1207 [Lentzea atacamensis]
MTTGPQNVYALVVGVAEYPRWDGADRPGLDHDAIKFAKWLRSCEVPPQNIKLLLSPMQDLLDTDLAVTAVPKTDADLEEAISAFPQGERDVLWVYWCGHGYELAGTRLALSSAFPGKLKNISLEELKAALSSDSVYGFRKQFFLVDTCRLWVTQGLEDLVSVIPVGKERKLGVEQTTLWACTEGEAAKYNNAKGGGEFSELLIEWLEKQDPSFVCMPDSARLVDEVIELAERRPESFPTPTVLKAWTPRGPRETHLGRHSEPPERKKYGLVAYTTTDGEPPARIHLDVAWGLDRGRIRAVLADFGDADLVGELSEVEDLVQSDGGLGLTPRRWWRHLVAHEQIPADLSVLLKTEDGERPAVVLSQVCSGEVQVDGVADNAVQAWVSRLQQTAPQVDVVVQVVAGTPVDALLAGRQTADALGRSGDTWSCYARNRVGVADGPGVLPPLDEVVEHVGRQANSRGLQRIPWLSGGPVELSGVEAPAAVGLLCAVRDLAPQWYRPLLRACAVLGSGPAWAAAAKVAARYDDDLDVWLEATGGDVPCDTVPGPRETWFGDAMCLAHLRAKKVETARRWSAGNASEAVKELVKKTENASVTTAELPGLGWDVVVSARRANTAVELAPVEVPLRTWRTEGLWAAIASAPVDLATLELLRHLPSHLAGVLGQEAELEPVRAEDVEKFRRVLRYVAMREEGTHRD